MCLSRQKSLFQTFTDLSLIRLRLSLVGRSQYNIIPFNKVLFPKASLIILSGIQIRLAEEKIFHLLETHDTSPIHNVTYMVIGYHAKVQ